MLVDGVIGGVAGALPSVKSVLKSSKTSLFKNIANKNKSNPSCNGSALKAQSSSTQSLENNLLNNTDEIIEGGSTTQAFLQKALKNQELDSVPNRMKEVWTEGDFKYTVRVHEGNPAYTNADSIYRVSRQSTILDANGQGMGLQYLGTDGNWYAESVLKEFFKDGTKNPLFNEVASKMTHIPVNGGK